MTRKNQGTIGQNSVYNRSLIAQKDFFDEGSGDRGCDSSTGCRGESRIHRHSQFFNHRHLAGQNQYTHSSHQPGSSGSPRGLLGPPIREINCRQRYRRRLRVASRGHELPYKCRQSSTRSAIIRPHVQKHPDRLRQHVTSLIPPSGSQWIAPVRGCEGYSRQ